MKAELIYVEKIEVSGLWLDITRQKDTPDGEWYGITLIGDGKIISDNESWIFDTFYPMLKEDKRGIKIGLVSRRKIKLWK